MNAITEQKEEITFAEFTAWLNGLVRGKKGELPDLDDWKMIKAMMQKVQPDVVEKVVYVPEYKPPYHHPDIQYYKTYPSDVFYTYRVTTTDPTFRVDTP